MALKTFIVDWDGQKRKIVYEDDISFGKFMEVVNNSGDMDKLFSSGEFEFRMDPFIRQLLVQVIKEPKEFTDDAEIAKVPLKIMMKVIPVIMKEYPLLDFLTQIAASIGAAGGRKRKRSGN